MAVGRYGNKALSSVAATDIEIWYTYSPDRETAPTYQLSSLPSSYINEFFQPQNASEVFTGLYNLTLPAGIFNQVGIYNIIIRPKQIRTTIQDCGTLSAVNERGLVLSLNGALDNQGNTVDLSSLISSLTGYKIEYLNNNNGQQSLQRNFFTIITSANAAEVVSSNLSTTTQKATTYRFNDSGQLIFLTVSPSTNINSIGVAGKTFIGEPNQPIILSNTNFDPLCIELELTNYDIDMIGQGIFGTKTLNNDTGRVTYFDEQGNITSQSTVFSIMDEISGRPLWEVIQQDTQIDTSENLSNILSNVQNPISS